jgi:hypothetical protein
MRARDALYLANASVLLTHQIDAAYWHVQAVALATRSRGSAAPSVPPAVARAPR